MTLHLYFGRRFLLSFLTVFGVFFLMMSLFDMLEQVRRFDGGEIGFPAVLTLTFLNVPSSIYGIFPLIMILSAIFMFLAVARSSELVIARAAGRSAVVTLMAPVTVAILIGGFAVAVLNPIVAGTSKQYEVLSNRFSASESSVLSISREGLWLRQGDADGQTVIRADRASLNGTELLGATFTTFDAAGEPVRRIEAERALLRSGAWELSRVKEWPLAGSGNPERNATTQETLSIPSNLTSDQIIDSFGTPSAIPIWALPEFIDRLETAGFSARTHRVWYHMELSTPLLMAAMVLVAAAFTMRPARFGRTGIMVVMAIGLGFTLYFVRNFAQVLGENGQIPILLAAWGPPIASVLLPLGLILHLEDG